MRPPWPDSLSWRWCAPYAPASGSKGSSTGVDARAQALEHLLEHVVGREPQPPIAYLHRHVAVAEMVGGAGERLGRIARDVQERLGRRHDLDHAAVGGDDEVPAAKHRAARERHGDLLAGLEPRELPALLPPVEGEDEAALHLDAIGGVGTDRQARADLDHQKRK